MGEIEFRGLGGYWIWFDEETGELVKYWGSVVKEETMKEWLVVLRAQHGFTVKADSEDEAIDIAERHAEDINFYRHYGEVIDVEEMTDDGSY